jgi:hypothetical protein
MNPQELMSAVRKLLIMCLTALATKLHLDGSFAPALATDLLDLATIGWGIYAHWNMVKVPETLPSARKVLKEESATEK